jgi:hypothetical protein
MSDFRPWNINSNLHYIQRPSLYRAVNTLRIGYKTSQLILYREIIAICSEIHTKHINTLCGQNVELLNVKLVVVGFEVLKQTVIPTGGANKQITDPHTVQSAHCVWTCVYQYSPTAEPSVHSLPLTLATCFCPLASPSTCVRYVMHSADGRTMSI